MWSLHRKRCRVIGVIIPRFVLCVIIVLLAISNNFTVKPADKSELSCKSDRLNCRDFLYLYTERRAGVALRPRSEWKVSSSNRVGTSSLGKTGQVAVGHWKQAIRRRWWTSKQRKRWHSLLLSSHRRRSRCGVAAARRLWATWPCSVVREGEKWSTRKVSDNFVSSLHCGLKGYISYYLSSPSGAIPKQIHINSYQT